jgi:hypothetical protein
VFDYVAAVHSDPQLLKASPMGDRIDRMRRASEIPRPRLRRSRPWWLARAFVLPRVRVARSAAGVGVGALFDQAGILTRSDSNDRL